MHYIIPPDHHGRRLDNYLISQFKDVPKSLWYRLMRKGNIRVNKKRVKPDFRLSEKDELILPNIHHEETKTKPIILNAQKINFINACILYEDDKLMILNKPSGLAVHGGSGIKMGVIEMLRAVYPSQFFSLAHRIDKETSGCLLIAKDQQALMALHDLFRTHTIQKTYYALTQGHWEPKQGSIKQALERNKLNAGERKVFVSEDGKTSVTHYHVLKCLKSADWVEFNLATGRMHQIRVHAAHSNHPIAGDDKYGDRLFNREMKKLGINRLCLHAASIAFTLDNKKYFIQAPLDPVLAKIVKK